MKRPRKGKHFHFIYDKTSAKISDCLIFPKNCQKFMKLLIHLINKLELS